MRNELRDAVVVEVQSRIVAACLRQSEARGGTPLDVLINDTLYHEKKRLEGDARNPMWESDVQFWGEVKSRLGRAGPTEQRRMLEDIVRRFVHEIVGNFNPMVYELSTRVIPRTLPVLLNAFSPKRLLRGQGLPTLRDTVDIRGNVEGLRRCQELGTVILTPTHVSNMDSPIVGWALYEMSLPPFTYGAGLNLFNNPLLSFFMRNLGAYRVDRLKKAPLYKDVLKEYTTATIEFGQSNLFFPAGTRVRSGMVEQKLKLGLLSSGLRAYINNLVRAKESPNVYVVPCTLNYHLVLEAETLIEDHLRAIGKSRYIIEDDESSRPRRIAQFLWSLVGLDSRITIDVAEPLDVFGNAVDDEGHSVDARGRRIDIARYVSDRDGNPGPSPQRDRVYTREAGEAVARSFKANNVALATNLVAFAVFEHLKALNPGMDLYRLLRTAGDGTGIEMRRLGQLVEKVLDRIEELRQGGRIRVEERMRGREPTHIISDALRHFGSYHTKPVLVRRGDRVFAEDMNLLLYYHNRLVGYGLEPIAAGMAGREAA